MTSDGSAASLDTYLIYIVRYRWSWYRFIGWRCFAELPILNAPTPREIRALDTFYVPT